MRFYGNHDLTVIILTISLRLCFRVVKGDAITAWIYHKYIFDDVIVTIDDYTGTHGPKFWLVARRICTGYFDRLPRINSIPAFSI